MLVKYLPASFTISKNISLLNNKIYFRYVYLFLKTDYKAKYKAPVNDLLLQKGLYLGRIRMSEPTETCYWNYCLNCQSCCYRKWINTVWLIWFKNSSVLWNNTWCIPGICFLELNDVSSGHMLYPWQLIQAHNEDGIYTEIRSDCQPDVHRGWPGWSHHIPTCFFFYVVKCYLNNKSKSYHKVKSFSTQVLLCNS